MNKNENAIRQAYEKITHLRMSKGKHSRITPSPNKLTQHTRWIPIIHRHQHTLMSARGSSTACAMIRHALQLAQ